MTRKFIEETRKKRAHIIKEKLAFGLDRKRKKFSQRTRTLPVVFILYVIGERLGH